MGRLADEPPDAKRGGLFAVARSVRGSQDHDGRRGEIGALSHRPKHREAVDAREIDVEEDEVRRDERGIGQLREGVLAVPRDLEIAVERALSEGTPHQVDVGFVVFPEEDPKAPLGNAGGHEISK